VPAANEIVWLKQSEIECSPLAAGEMVSEIDLMNSTSADCLGEAGFNITGNGLCHALLGWIRIRLGRQWLSTGTDHPELHWRNGLLPVDPPLPLASGDSLKLKLQRKTRGDWHWQLASGSQRRVHSTFLSRANDKAFFEKQQPEHHGSLNNRGLAILLVLAMIGDGKSNREMIAALQENHQGLFPDTQEAARFVQDVVLEFSK
jgi:hypothetical protein